MSIEWVCAANLRLYFLYQTAPVADGALAQLEVLSWRQTADTAACRATGRAWGRGAAHRRTADFFSRGPHRRAKP